MSIRTQYNCPKCRHVISAYSKKGFELLHTNIGIPYLKCVNCSTLIKTNHSPYNQMTQSDKVIEWIKIFLHTSIYSLLFGVIGGLFIGWGINKYLLNSTEIFNFLVIVCVIALLFIRLLVLYMKWIKATNNYDLSKQNSIDSNLYNHPDW